MILSLISSIIDLSDNLLDFNWKRLKNFGEYLVRVFRHDGVYEVLEHHVTLELKDRFGKKAIYQKCQKIRFLQNNISTYHDKAWGSGKIFADYRCFPGRVVDIYREGLFYWILISFRETKQRGDIENIRIERTIEDGFIQKEEDWQTDVDHYTEKLVVNIIFPYDRHPQYASIVQNSTKSSRKLSLESYTRLPDGRLRVTWEKAHVTKKEAYILRWTW